MSCISIFGFIFWLLNHDPPVRNETEACFQNGEITIVVRVTQGSVQIELIFRLLLKITVERPHECDFTHDLCPP